MDSIVILLLVVLAAFPIIAIIALVRANSLQKEVNQIPRLIQRIYETERKLAALGQQLDALAREPAVEPAATKGVMAEKPSQAAPVQLASQLVTKAPESDARQSALPPGTGNVPPQTTTEPKLPAPPPITAPVPRPWQRSNERDVESTIAGRWFNYVGILAIALAISFFLKYAFDNDWIGPTGRVTAGMLAGAALYPLSHWIFKRGYAYYAEGIAGLGAAILYLSVWAGWRYYHIFSQDLAFPLMIVITAFTVAVAVGRDSERIGVLSLAGGLLTPILVSTGQNAEVALFSYLFILCAAMLAIAWMRRWKSIAPVAFGGALIYFWGWYSDFYNATELGATVLFATLFFLLFAALPAVRGAREGELSGLDIGVVVSNAFQYLIALRLMLWPEYRWGLTFAVLALAAAHLMAGRALPRKNSPGNSLPRVLYDGLALAFATLAIPIRLHGKWITIVFAAEGLVLIWSGLRARSWALRAAGLALFAIVGIRLGIFSISAPAPAAFLLNERFLTLAVCAACWLGAFFLARNSDCELAEAETQFYFAAAIAANFCFLLALSMDVWDWFGRIPSLGIDRARPQEMALSVLWVAYGLALLVAGMVRKSAAVRWQGLALLCLAIGKAFFFDLSFLTTFYRIVSFFVLGLVLLAVSFFYQKRPKAHLKTTQP